MVFLPQRGFVMCLWPLALCFAFRLKTQPPLFSVCCWKQPLPSCTPDGQTPPGYHGACGPSFFAVHVGGTGRWHGREGSRSCRRDRLPAVEKHAELSRRFASTRLRLVYEGGSCSEFRVDKYCSGLRGWHVPISYRDRVESRVESVA